VDRERAAAFSETLLRRYSDAMTVLFIDLGDRTGLLDAATKGGTVEDIATRAGLAERPVREWLHGMVTSGVVEHDPDTGSFRLPVEHASLLTGETPYNLAPLARAASAGFANASRIAKAFRDGGGIPSDELHDGLFEIADRMSRYRFDALMTDVYLPTSGPVYDRLREHGGRVADIGCGTGHAVNVMARAMPAAEVVGYDLHQPALDRGRAEAQQLGLDNVRFERADVTAIAADGDYDLITAFDVIHDLPDPKVALTAIRQHVSDDGVFLLYDVGAPSDLAAQVDLPWAPLMYGFSTSYCIQNSLAGGGEALGNMWGRERTEALLRDVGFPRIEVTNPPLDPINLLYVCHP